MVLDSIAWDIIPGCVISNHHHSKAYNVFLFCSFFVLCQFSFTRGVLTFYIMFWAWILVSLQVNDVLVWGLSIFCKGCYVIRFGCVENDGCSR
jgi:hypothetical protein